MESKKSKSHVEYIVAATAFVVSISTLAVYIYQAKIMSAQQHVSVWPYLTWDTSDVDGYQITVRNKGVGPAVIRKIDMRIGGKSIQGNAALIENILGPDTNVHVINSYIDNRVVAPSESIDFFQIRDATDARTFAKKFGQSDFKLEITYCSIYGECWISEGIKVRRIPDIELNIY
jgi:hypothetical protein